MNGLLQRFGFKESRYERPNQKWVCGWRVEGRECPLGPDARGHCQSVPDCVPQRKADRWYCTRPASAGGPCAEGPLPDGPCSRPVSPCRPVRTWRARRGLVGWLAVAFTFGALAFLLGGTQRWRLVSPGPLTSHHALTELTCRECHAVPAQGRSAKVAGIVTRLDQHQESRLCLNCHNLGSNAFLPHSVASAQLQDSTRPARRTRASGTRPVALALSSILFSRENNELACAECHSEHHGKDFQLNRLDNEQCQSCHANQFATFADGHPDFTKYPYNRRTRIIFDHISHLTKHFQEPPFQPRAPTACTSCHAADAAGRKMLVNSFAVACAACHSAQIEGEGRADSPAIAFLTVPALDTETLFTRGIWLGDWPADANAEGKLTPFMEVLLSADPKTQPAMRALTKLDLTNLQDASADQFKAVEQLAWAVKELFFDLETKGHTALLDRLQKIAPPEWTKSEMTPLVGQLPRDVILGGQRDWFPNLLAEVPLHQSGGKPATNATEKAVAPSEKSALGAVAKATTPEAWVVRGGWYRSPNDYVISYRPTGHADSFLRSWLDFAAAAPISSEKTPLNSLFKSLSGRNAPGFCSKCHSVDANGDQMRQINWRPARPVPYEHPFTKFSHSTHFSLLDQKGCLTCHELDAKSEYLKAFENNLRPTIFSANFRPIQKAVCSHCHTARFAGNRCLECHNYHVGTFGTTLSKAGQSRKLTDSRKL